MTGDTPSARRWTALVPTAIAVGAAFALTLLAGYSGLTIRLGAHPFWAVSTAWIGGAVGLIVAVGLGTMRVRRRNSLLLAAVVIVVSATAAHFGKQAFAASYAEDTFAGHLWYYGWIGGLAGCAFLIAVILWPRIRR